MPGVRVPLSSGLTPVVVTDVVISMNPAPGAEAIDRGGTSREVADRSTSVRTIMIARPGSGGHCRRTATASTRHNLGRHHTNIEHMFDSYQSMTVCPVLWSASCRNLRRSWPGPGRKSAVSGRLKPSTCAVDPCRCPLNGVAECVGPAPAATVIRVVVMAAVNAIVVGGCGPTGCRGTHRREGTCNAGRCCPTVGGDVKVPERTGGTSVGSAGALAFIRTHDAPVGTWVSHFCGDVVLPYLCED